MGKQKLRVHNTQLDNLISNLRGEVGEVITSWVLLCHLMSKERDLGSSDVANDMRNQSLAFVGMLRAKLSDEIVARLSELAEPKTGRLTFHFAAQKLKTLDREVKAFSGFIAREKFQQKRNLDISHKELPEQWATHGPIVIPYRTLRRAVGHALRLMKMIDNIVLGPAAKYLWREMRKRRYQLMAPASAMYMMVPHLKLSGEVRQRIVMEEMAAGRQVWSEMPTTVNGQETNASVCREWGVILLGGHMVSLDEYPLVQLNSVVVPPPDPAAVAAIAHADPVTEQRKIVAKYRVTKLEGDSRICFAPVQRVQRLDDSSVTELVDIHINLDDKLRHDFGDMKLGDEKEFSLVVTVLTGYRLQGDGDT